MRKRINMAIRGNMFWNMIMVAFIGALWGEFAGLWFFPADREAICDCERVGMLGALLLLAAIIELTGGRKTWTEK